MDSDDELTEFMCNLNLHDNSEINILLLGETGVGKSTFINAIANYFQFGEFENAYTAESLAVLIPSEFSITDMYKKCHKINIGKKEDENEYLTPGESATQDVKTYVFPIFNGKAKLRLIDTPGMGDTRGISQDNINCEYILSYIGKLSEIHAICFLLKPTNTRLTASFTYCIKTIFSHLDKSAADNIIFCFTNTRGTDYTAGETHTCLKKIVNEVKRTPPHVTIPLSGNYFYFDNESFRYLAALKEGFDFKDEIIAVIIDSWQKSLDQCLRMIKYIVGDSNKPGLKPHNVSQTISINEARKFIMQLSQPLAEISQNIENNVRLLERHRADLNAENQSIEDLKENLYVPIINLKVKELPQPVTVCTSAQCSEVVTVKTVNLYHYKTRCHNPCYLNNVPKEIIGDPELTHCWAMSGNNCRICGCSYKLHMHIYYETETCSEKMVDENTAKNIQTKEGLLEEAQKVTKKIEKQVKILNGEHEIITKTAARFAHFLQNNAITPFNDSYKDYIKYLIVRERSLGPGSNDTVISRLESLIVEYDQIKASFDMALKDKNNVKAIDCTITPHKIKEYIDELFNLPENGPKIKQLYNTQKTARKTEHKDSEYYHDGPITKAWNYITGKNKKGKKKNQKNKKETKVLQLTELSSTCKTLQKISKKSENPNLKHLENMKSKLKNAKEKVQHISTDESSEDSDQEYVSEKINLSEEKSKKKKSQDRELEVQRNQQMYGWPYFPYPPPYYPPMNSREDFPHDRENFHPPYGPQFNPYMYGSPFYQPQMFHPQMSQMFHPQMSQMFHPQMSQMWGFNNNLDLEPGRNRTMLPIASNEENFNTLSPRQSVGIRSNNLDEENRYSESNSAIENIKKNLGTSKSSQMSHPQMEQLGEANSNTLDRKSKYNELISAIKNKRNNADSTSSYSQSQNPHFQIEQQSWHSNNPIENGRGNSANSRSAFYQPQMPYPQMEQQSWQTNNPIENGRGNSATSLSPHMRPAFYQPQMPHPQMAKQFWETNGSQFDRDTQYNKPIPSVDNKENANTNRTQESSSTATVNLTQIDNPPNSGVKENASSVLKRRGSM